jgi:hypothetical protein
LQFAIKHNKRVFIIPLKAPNHFFQKIWIKNFFWNIWPAWFVFLPKHVAFFVQRLGANYGQTYMDPLRIDDSTQFIRNGK